MRRLSLLLPLLFWLALAAITLLALAPKPPPAADLGWDKFNHVAAFALLGLLARAAWPRASWWRWALALLVYGALLELAQGQTPNRHAEWADLLADAIGLVAAASVAGPAAAWRRSRQSPGASPPPAPPRR